MTTHYESVHPVTLYPDAFHVAAPDTPVAHDLFPRRPGVFIRQCSNQNPHQSLPSPLRVKSPCANS